MHLVKTDASPLMKHSAAPKNMGRTASFISIS